MLCLGHVAGIFFPNKMLLGIMTTLYHRCATIASGHKARYRIKLNENFLCNKIFVRKHLCCANFIVFVSVRIYYRIDL